MAEDPADDLAREADWPRDALDRDYNARASVTPEAFDAAMHAYRARSEEMRPLLHHADVPYDAASGQTMDIYGTGERPRPVFVFLHGGYWRMLSKADSAFMARALAAEGVATAVVDYRLIPQVDLSEIVREVRAAVAFLHREGARFGLDPQAIHVGGSSAGGHLAGAVLSGGWHGDFGVPEDVVKSALPISGLFHLGPVAASFAQEWLALSPGDVARLSPALHMPPAPCPVTVAYAAGEPAGFARQSRAYHRLLRQAGMDAALLEVPGRNHFDVLLDLAEPESALSRALLAQIRGDGAA
jgi:arylformamidase